MIRLTRGGPLHLGVNYRLAYGWDFLAGELGLENPERLALVEADFAQLARHGAKLVRWFLFNDGRGRERWSPAALRAGMAAAERYGLGVLLVLLDHTFCYAEERDGAFVKQGHGAWLKDAGRFERLMGEWLEPAIVEAGECAAVTGFELLNEPEMAMRRRDHWWRGATGTGFAKVPAAEQLTLGEMRERMAACARAVHWLTDKQFSIGSVSSRWLGQWERVLDPARDFLTFHYYGDGDERDLDRMMEARVAPVAARLPVGIGEFYPRGCECIPPSRQADPWPDYSLTDFFRAAERHRLQAAMPWVWNPGAFDPGEIPMDEWVRYSGAG